MKINILLHMSIYKFHKIARGIVVSVSIKKNIPDVTNRKMCLPRKYTNFSHGSQNWTSSKIAFCMVMHRLELYLYVLTKGTKLLLFSYSAVFHYWFSMVFLSWTTASSLRWFCNDLFLLNIDTTILVTTFNQWN